MENTNARLRVPPELKKLIEDQADKNNRSQSAEMISRLEQSFELEKAFLQQGPIVSMNNSFEVIQKLQVLGAFASSHLCEGFNDFRSAVEAKAEELINKL